MHAADGDGGVRGRCGQPSAEVADGGEEPSGFDDRVYTEIGSGSVGGRAVDGDLRPHEPAVRHDDVESAGFDHDGGVGDDVAQDLLCAGTAPFLIGDERDDDVARREDGLRPSRPPS